ncbi:hypothetical protein B0H17DRAFT_1207021 [Mycena rosella]|uniref:RlpA-like protein double-psi beta-barrel domain-containing protein n=1 Tax=Mycena rosella TaxID=1033263 RepID=A0AAD7D3R1_MYCRO|nr:hypothetical protein B0H17DRAFT_1207021 [Mycena rosella]
MNAMSRATVLFTVLFCAMLAFAAPLQQGNATLSELDKRITHVGRGTWYHPSDGEGNCGYWDSDSALVWIAITNTANGKLAYGKTRDSCVSCDTSSLDMSPALFQKISTLATGEITISWNFQPAGWSP